MLLPREITGIEQIHTTVKLLGVWFTDNQSFAVHVDNTLRYISGSVSTCLRLQAVQANSYQSNPQHCLNSILPPVRTCVLAHDTAVDHPYVANTAHMNSRF